jgi:hypothetical protein
MLPSEDVVDPEVAPDAPPPAELGISAGRAACPKQANEDIESSAARTTSRLGDDIAFLCTGEPALEGREINIIRSSPVVPAVGMTDK